MEWLLLSALIVCCIVLAVSLGAARSEIRMHRRKLTDLETYAWQVHVRLQALEASRGPTAAPAEQAPVEVPRAVHEQRRRAPASGVPLDPLTVAAAAVEPSDLSPDRSWTVTVEEVPSRAAPAVVVTPEPETQQPMAPAEPSQQPMAPAEPSQQPSTASTDISDPSRITAPQSEGVAAGSPTPESPQAPEAKAPERAFDWEGLVGVRFFSWIAGLALVLAAVFFLRYSVESGWLTPPIRVAIGMIVGIALLVVCEWRGAGYRITANALDAAGIATLFATSFAATALWHLIPMSAAFLLLALTAATAVLLSLRRDSLFIALLGLLGGFATPVVLSTGEDRPVGLFGYLLLLNVGLGIVAQRKRWPVLWGATVLLTAVYQWGWVAKFVFDNPSELPLATAVFVLFPAVTVALHFLGQRWRSTAPPAPSASNTVADPSASDPVSVYGWIVSASAVAPLLFACCMGLAPAFGRETTLFWGFLLIVDASMLALDIARPKEPVLPIGAALTVLAVACWLGASYSSEAWPGVLGFLAAPVCLFLAGPTIARGLGRTISVWTHRAQYASALLLFAFPVLCHLEPMTRSPLLLFAMLFALLALIAGAAIARENGPLYFLATFLALLAEVAWSRKHLTPEQSKPALVLYAAFGLFYLGVPAIARRAGRSLRPEGSASVLLLASILLVLFTATGPGAPTSLWGIGLLLVVLNIGLFAESRSGRLPLLSIAGVVFSWIVIGVLWYGAMTPELMVPSLLVMAALGLIALAGNASILRTAMGGQSGGAAMGHAGLLGLVGHGFLFYVAVQPSLANPPWPLLAILVLLDLGALAFALYTRRMLVLQAALVASPVIVLAWALAADPATASGLTWSEVALLCGLGFAALAVASMGVVRWRRLDPKPLILASEIVLNETIALLAVLSGTSHAPDLAWTIGAQAVLIAVLMAMGQRNERDGALLVAVLPVSLGQVLWALAHLRPDRYYEQLILAGVPYVLFSAYPVLRGARARTSRRPFYVALAASVPAFLSGYDAMLQGEKRDIIGILPLTQAIVTAGLLVYLLRRLERSGPRDIARLSLVAAVALGFVTMAIPLQLENEWITIGWALEAAALAWLHSRLGHPGLSLGSFGLAAAAFVRLSLNQAVFEYHPRAQTPIWNWYLYAYAVSAAALFGAAWCLRRGHAPKWRFLKYVNWLQCTAATLLLFLLLNIEIADWYSQEGAELTFNFSSTLAEDLTYTLGWAVFGVGMLTAGIVLGSRATRIAALGLLTITSGKCFLHDLWRLGGLYRVASFVGLAVCLSLVAIVLQRFVLTASSAQERKS